MTFPVPGSNWSYGRSIYVYKPSDDDSGERDANAINGLLAQGTPVFLLAGQTYFINQPIIPTYTSFLSGFQWYSASQDDDYSAGIGQPGGAVLQAVNFSGSAMISMVNDSNSQIYGVDISGITLYASSSIPAATHGIEVIGAWGACFMRGLMVQKPGADCLHMDVSGSSGKIPDDWQITDCKFSGARNGNGVNIPNNLPDSWFDNCESSENNLDGWATGWCDNTRWSNCKGENNGATGWHFISQGAGHLAMLSNCSSQLNNSDGFLFDNSAGGGGLGDYMLTGCRSRADNQSGGTTAAAFRADGCTSRISGTGCNGQGAAYGAYEGGASYGMCFTGSYFAGTTAATQDDGTNTHALVNQSPVPF